MRTSPLFCTIAALAIAAGAGAESRDPPLAASPDSSGHLLRPPAVPVAGAALFADGFRTLEAWHPDREDVWTAQDSILCGRLPDGKQRRSFLYAGSEDWQDYAVDLDLLQLRGVDKGIAVRVHGGRGIAVDLRGGDYQDVLVYRQSMALGRAPAADPDRVWHHLRVEASGNHYTILVDGRQVLACRDPIEASRRGRIALVAYTGGRGECSVQYANVVVTKLE